MSFRFRGAATSYVNDNTKIIRDLLSKQTRTTHKGYTFYHSSVEECFLPVQGVGYKGIMRVLLQLVKVDYEFHKNVILPAEVGSSKENKNTNDNSNNSNNNNNDTTSDENNNNSNSNTTITSTKHTDSSIHEEKGMDTSSQSIYLSVCPTISITSKSFFFDLSEEPLDWTWLPTDIWLEIFDHLSERQLSDVAMVYKIHIHTQ